jgi:hypothetical protein
MLIFNTSTLKITMSTSLDQIYKRKVKSNG